MNDYADNLIELAHWLKERPTLLRKTGEWAKPSVSIYLYGEDEADEKALFGTIMREIGECKKSGHNGTINVSQDYRDEDGNRMFSVSVSLQGACTKVPKVDEDGKPVTKPKVRFVETDEVEPVYDWHCPESFLNL